MTPCDRPDCTGGAIDAQGFCTVCDREPLSPVPAGQAAPPHDGPATPPPPAPAATGVAQVRPDPWYGLGLVDDTPVPATPDTRRDAQPDPEPLAEGHRFCADPACGHPVGRSVGDLPGRVSGYCGQCGTQFDFSRAEGLVIADRYEVRSLLGQGAYGVAYLAHDRNLATDVVVKQLRTTVARSARERDVLVQLRHDAIVRVLGYEEDGDSTYLVLEYIPGSALAPRHDDSLQTLLAHGLRLLQALDYLHARDLLHCDVKPLNIVRFHEAGPRGLLDRVRLIDFGAVRSTADTDPLDSFTERYAPLPGDQEFTTATPGFDLYGLGATLKEACRTQLADRSDPGVNSLELLLRRATHPGGPARRFTSARQFGEQLSGVLRQVVAAAPAGRQVTRASALFGAWVDALHGGVGAPRPIGDWIRATVHRDAAAGVRLELPPPFTAPGPRAVATALPMPLGDPDDRTVNAEARRQLAGCRAALARWSTGDAALALDAAGLPEGHWLVAWYTALIALVSGETAAAEVERAARHFATVREALPGELVPQLALGLCAERLGDRVAAEAHYAAVFATTPALGAAAFGLARVRSLAGSTAEAVRVADALAHEFRHRSEARIASLRLHVAGLGADATDDDLAPARAELARIDVDDAGRAALSTELGWAQLRRGGGRQDQLAFSESVRDLAQHAVTERDYVALIDLANAVRPELKSLWGGRRRARRSTTESRRGFVWRSPQRRLRAGR